MKTDVIHLEPFDDIDSIRDRLEWSKAGRIVLAWPKRGDIPISQLEMILLARKAAALGRQIAIVNCPVPIEEMARSAGIPVFYSQGSATLAGWPKAPDGEIDRLEAPDHKSLREDVERLRETPELKFSTRVLAFVTGVAAVLALALFFLPGATVEVYPAEIEQTLRLPIQASPSILEADIAGNIPMRSLTSLQQASDRIETSGQLLVPDKHAKGEVTLENLTGNALTVPAGTVVATLTDPAVRFETLAKIDLAAGQEAPVDIQAVRPGSGGNVREDEIRSLEGPLGLDIAVRNEEPTSGGQETTLRSPSEDDIATLREKVKSMLLAQAKQDFQDMQADVSGGQTFLEDSLKIEKVVEEDVSTPAGQPADFLEVMLSGEVRMDYILQNDVRAALRGAMDANLPDGFEPAGEDLTFVMIGEPAYDRGSVTMKWAVEGRRRLRSSYSPQAVIQAVTGKSPGEAVQSLSGMMKHKAVPQILMSPSWWPRLPYLPFRIEVRTGL